jgi:hypothetical protein
MCAAACGPPTLRPTSSTDPSVACPGGQTAWSLEILDQRANREGSQKLVALLSDSITRSFPGCSWGASDGAGRHGSILIEIHRFSAPFVDDSWSGAAEWAVLVRDASGRTLLEFEASDEVERPNYYGSNNEKEALQQVFEGALKKTLAALRSVSSPG